MLVHPLHSMPVTNGLERVEEALRPLPLLLKALSSSKGSTAVTRVAQTSSRAERDGLPQATRRMRSESRINSRQFKAVQGSSSQFKVKNFSWNRNTFPKQRKSSHPANGIQPPGPEPVEGHPNCQSQQPSGARQIAEGDPKSEGGKPESTPLSIQASPSQSKPVQANPVKKHFPSLNKPPPCSNRLLNHRQPSPTTANHRQPSPTTANHRQPSPTTANHRQPPPTIAQVSDTMSARDHFQEN
jgi:hypothetical protein